MFVKNGQSVSLGVVPKPVDSAPTVTVKTDEKDKQTGK
jgi:hypothetical protein